MFDRKDKKNNVIGFKTNSALALFTSIILAENNHVNQYIFIPKRITSILCKTNKPTTCIKYISAGENIIKKIFLKLSYYLRFAICF